jgi:hypothetical protein
MTTINWIIPILLCVQNNEQDLRGSSSSSLWIQMNFYLNPSGVTSQETFLALRYVQKD